MLFTFKIFEPYSDRLSHGVIENFQDYPEAVIADQIHTDNILELSEKPKKLPQCDGFVTREKELPIMVKTADCQGLILFDPKKNIVSTVHSGWRGSTLNIIGKAVERMQEMGSNPKNILAGIGPSLGPCCAEFSDPMKELPKFCHPFILLNNCVDFWSLSMYQLKDAGLSAFNIELSAQCTKCRPDYHSHRRNPDGQRMGVFAKLK